MIRYVKDRGIHARLNTNGTVRLDEAMCTALVEAGRQKYMQVCIACHGMEGKGRPALGAPNLTDDVWLYGGSEDAIAEGLYLKGRNGKMPAHRDILGRERARILAAYVYGLSR